MLFVHTGPTTLSTMNKFLTLACALIFLGLTAFRTASEPAAPSAGGLDEVIAALRAGNATELAKYVDDNIEISLPEKSDNYSRAQALMILQDFFANNSVRGFEVKHKGDNGGNQFCIGTLITKAGNYRTIIYMRNKNGRQLIKDIKFQST